MKIIYSPFYDSDPFVGDSPNEMGVLYVGNLGLLRQLQLRAGMHMEAKSDVEREADYQNAMLRHCSDMFFEKAAEMDPIGVAGRLLKWRDALVMAGWDGTCSDASATKIQALAKIEKDFRSTGNADCWKAVCNEYAKGDILSGEVENIKIDTAWHEIPYLVQKTLDAIKENGTEVITTNVAEELRLDPYKIEYLEFDDVNDAYEWFAQIDELPKGTVVVNRDNTRLNHTLYTWNRPLIHSSLKDSNPQLLQLFKLSMSIFSRPLNINNLVSYLMLPMSPIPGKLRYSLAKQLMSHGGFGNKVERMDGEVRDDWDEIIETFEFLGKDGNDSPQARGIAKAKKMPFLEPIRKDYSKGISKSEVVGYAENLQKWITGHYADEELPMELNAQLHELSAYLHSFHTALTSLADMIDYEQIEKLILQIYCPMDYSLQTDQVGAINVINDVRALAKDAETLIWLDCQEEDIERDPYDFLSAKEKEYLVVNGCVIPDFAQHLQTSRKEKLRALGRCERIILVRSKYNGTTRLGEHPIVSEARYTCGQAGIDLTPTEVASLFPLVGTSSQTNAIEVLQPVKALELGEINYPGHKESNTSLDTLIQLPFNYVMQYVAKLATPDDEQLSNVSITTGLVAHHFFEHITKDAGCSLDTMRQLTESEFTERLESAIDATGLIMRLPENASTLAEFRTQLKDSMLSLIEIMERKEWTPVGCEMAFPENDEETLNLPTIGKFGARVDYLVKQGDEYVIIDFKWSYSKKYGEHLKDNTAIQLELYRQAVLETYKGKKVAGVAYYLMPRKQLVTTDFEAIPNSKLIKQIEPASDKDLFDQIQASYKFRMEELHRGHIEESEMMVVSDDKDSYYANIEAMGLCPLNVDEEYEGRGANRVFVSAKKESEQIFKPTKKQTFENANAEPSEKATSHPILKGRLK